ncbi:MAG: preprotein translocase subunit SecG [Candidatus Omnitrophica bacterium]|nr:preprotein translocase subunit SecG [Candidatus Omnitrophota bacterium]MBU4488575.1 preprotein translocase subunit SecG [Candidatus Omnitrophota bacterium]MCG2704455.1 preprotein translocase subunit SecG [Candidatus Omnitrophota bacterium]
MLYNFVMAIHIIVSMVLILVILMQAGRGSGVSEMFGGSTQTIFGTSASNFLMKATAAAAVIFIITCMTLAIMSSNRSRSLMESSGAVSQETGKAMDASKAKDMPAANEKTIPSQPE